MPTIGVVRVSIGFVSASQFMFGNFDESIGVKLVLWLMQTRLVRKSRDLEQEADAGFLYLLRHAMLRKI